jgi:ubiquinone/menaquinone biosynthesis C-methylase UbiE
MVKLVEYERWYSIGDKQIDRFWQRFGIKPNMSDKHVLDFGCGTGRFCLLMARAGARKVLGVDVVGETINFARKKIQAQPGAIQSRIEFRVSDLRDLRDDTFDLVVSKDVFEHVVDLENSVRHLKRILKKGGRIYAAIGPLYASPFGFHNRWRYLYPWLKIQVPWLHLFFPESVLVNQWNKHHTTHVRNLTEGIGLNKMRFREYMAIINRSGLKIVHQRINVRGGFLSCIFSYLRRARILEDYCTFNTYIVLEKL